jgi:hypothetical protein
MVLSTAEVGHTVRNLSWLPRLELPSFWVTTGEGGAQRMECRPGAGEHLVSVLPDG